MRNDPSQSEACAISFGEYDSFVECSYNVQINVYLQSTDNASPEEEYACQPEINDSPGTTNLDWHLSPAFQFTNLCEIQISSLYWMLC